MMDGKIGEERMQELTIQEIHEVTLGILKKIDAVASAQDLKYFMAYGTLIGVIRHQGFIPWDDDLDIMMVRRDYEKLIAYFEEHEEELYPYKVFTVQNNKNYPHMIARICNTEYPIRVNNEKECGLGVFIDVYPLDGLGTDPAVWRRMLRKRQQLIAGSYYATRKRFEVPKKKYRIPDKFLLYVFAKIVGRDFFTNQLEQYKNIFSWDDSRYVGCAVWEPEMFEKKYFMETTRMPFCDMQVMVPKEYDKLLRTSYGDYMQLPPEEDRHPQHNYKAYRR